MISRAQKILIGVALASVIGLIVIGLILAVSLAAVRAHQAATRAGNEAATLQNIKTIAAVEVQYFKTHNRSYGALSDLVNEQLLSSKFAGKRGVADGYVFRLTLNIDLMREPSAATSYTLSADPVDESTGRNHFYLDSTSEKIHVNPETSASASDPIQ